MPDVSFGNLFAVCLAGALAPLLLGFAPRLRLPAVVLEIVIGIVLGPSVLGWVEVDLPVQILSLIGLAFLLFLSGLEIDPRRLHGRLLRVALLGYLVTLALGFPSGSGADAAGWVSSPVLLVIALSATSLGLVVPVLKDAGRADGEVGQTTIVAATVADFSAIVLLSLLFSASDGGPGSRIVLIGAFALLVAADGSRRRSGRHVAPPRRRPAPVAGHDRRDQGALRGGSAHRLHRAGRAIRAGEHPGAFLAGVVVSVVDRDSTSHPFFRAKLEAVGFGFVIPVFFVSSGIKLDLQGLLDSPSALLRVPVFLVALLVMRGVPALLYVKTLGRRPPLAAALLQATSLPFIVAATQIGVELGNLSAVTAAAIVSAGLLSVLIFPAVALSLLREPSDGSGEALHVQRAALGTKVTM